MKPACFESDQQYASWLKLFNISERKHVDICEDCTPCFARKMRAEGRCENPTFAVPNPYTRVDLPCTNIPGPKLGRPRGPAVRC